ncbi:PRC-barrel domain containing protein [Halorubrum sp. CSM-61]|uniref:PRC-barrel domain containing protein n=1 Tax=Halorubrum sp. CSM-61 TaxID=2485838 RepID=UPI000F4B70D9|nr:PRC-barrel domain containing protein [Halorubrum sp. CSM-61]
MDETTYTDEEVGKHVVTADGDRVGTVTAVRHGTPYIDPDPDAFDRIKAAMGWEDVNDDAYPLQEGEVDEITNEEIRLRQF